MKTQNKPDLKVVKLDVVDLRSHIAVLEKLVEDIEDGVYGNLTSVGVVTFGDHGMHIFGGGEDSQGATIALLFQAAAMRFAQGIAWSEEQGDRE